MVIPMRPGPRGLSSRPPLYSQLYQARSRNDLIDLTSMEEESAPDDSRGPIELSRDSVERVREASQRVSWMGDYPSEIHVTSPRENASGEPLGKVGSFRPLRNDNNDHHSHEHNTQKTEYGWSAHDYPSVVNVTGIDDVSEMGFLSQNGDQMSARESLPSKTPIVYAQSFHQRKNTTVGLDSTASDILSRMKAITGRMDVERMKSSENNSTSPRNSSSVATGRAIVDGGEIRNDDRDDLPLEVNIKARNDPRDGTIQVSHQSTHDTNDKIERGDYVPGEVKVSLHPSSPLRYAQVGYEPSRPVRDDCDKEYAQENDDARDLLPSRSSQSSRSTQSMYLRALSRRLSEKWKRNGVMSKGFEALPLSTSEPFAASESEQAIGLRDVDFMDGDGPEIIDLNDYEDNEMNFFMETQPDQANLTNDGNVQGQMHADAPPATRTDDQSVTSSEPVDVQPSEEFDQNNHLQSIEGAESRPDESCTQKESSENHSCYIGDDKALDADLYASEVDTQESTSKSRERGRSRVSRAARKRRITGRSLQSPRGKSPQRGSDKNTSGGLQENVEPNGVQCYPIDEKKGTNSPKSQQVTQLDEEFDITALDDLGDNELREHHVYKTGLGATEAKSEARMAMEEPGNVPVNVDNDVNMDRANGNHQETDAGEDHNIQPISLNLNISDYGTATSGSSTFEVEVEDLYVSSSNSEEGKETRIDSIDVIHRRSSDEAEDNVSVAYSNSSESDLEPEYDIYDQCVMPFIPNFLDTACAWLDGEEYGIRPQQSASSLLYKLHKKNKNVGRRKNTKKGNRSRSKTNRSSRGSNVDLRNVSRFARPRRSADTHVEISQDRDPPNSVRQTSFSPHMKARTNTQSLVASEGDVQPQLENGRNPSHEPVRFTFSESKSSMELSERSPAATTDEEKPKLSPSGERQPALPATDRNDSDGTSRCDEVELPLDLDGGQESPFRKKLQERMESIKSRDTTGDEERTLDQIKDATPKTSPQRFVSYSPLRVPQDPPSLTPKRQQASNDMHSPKQAEIVKISPKTKQNERERINSTNRPSAHSGYLPGASTSPIHDKQMAIFRDGRLVVTDAVPRSQKAAQYQSGTFAESPQSVSQRTGSERPFDEPAQKLEPDADQSFVNKLRERNTKRLSNAAGGPETLQGIRARRRMIEQKQYASSSRNRRTQQEQENEPTTHEPAAKSRDAESYSPQTAIQHKDKTGPERKQSPYRSPSKLSRERGSSNEAPIDVIDAELAASLAIMNEDERNAALELVEKLRRRASTLQRRHKVRNRRLQNIEEFQDQNKRFSESSDSYEHFPSLPRDEWEGNGYSISAA